MFHDLRTIIFLVHGYGHGLSHESQILFSFITFHE